MENLEFSHRRAPYAPISALREFFERIRDVSVPHRVDRRFLQKLNVASSNEWALLSSLKFLEVVDVHGEPTHAYRLLQTSDRFEETLRHLVEVAYRQLFEVDGNRMSVEDLENYFRVTSSPSQAKNAARFFREVCKLAGILQSPRDRSDNRGDARTAEATPRATSPAPDAGSVEIHVASPPPSPSSPSLLDARLELMRKLPICRSDWSATDYEAICRRFVELLKVTESTGQRNPLTS